MGGLPLGEHSEKCSIGKHRSRPINKPSVLRFELETAIENKEMAMTKETKTGATALPADFEQKVREQFDGIKCPSKKDFPHFLETARAEFTRRQAVLANPEKAYMPRLGSMTACGNGGFELELNPAEWQGASGALAGQPFGAANVVSALGMTFPFAAFTSGIVPGPITSTNAHHTWVGVGTDPNVPISTTAPGSMGAVRIGNQVGVGGHTCSVLSKTFIVSPANAHITFWYAVVMECPHAAASFVVRVTDSTGNQVPGAFAFGNGTNRVTYDANNPMWKDLNGAIKDGAIVYKDWSCAQIDLSTKVGEAVTVEFIVSDCMIGRWAYAYIDSFCGSCKGSPTGSISYDCRDSKHCGKGTICFDYELPHATVQSPVDGSLVIVTGAVEIKLDILQGGSVIHTLTSGPLTTGNRYCFAVDPAAIPGINASLGGFDFTASGDFSIATFAGTTKLGTQHMGRAPDGMILGTNNDYRMACRSCDEIRAEHDARVHRKCAAKKNTLQRYDCRCPDGSWVAGGCGCDGKSKSAGADHGDCGCGCGGTVASGSAASVKHDDAQTHVAAQEDKDPCRKFESCDLSPEISVRWGDSACDCLESDDVEVLCITVCNHFSNLTYVNFSIGQIIVTEMDGTPVPTLPDGSASIQFIPSGAICFGDIGPCVPGRQNCVTREVALYTRGAKGKNYRLSFDGVCFTVQHAAKTEACFVLPICQD